MHDPLEEIERHAEEYRRLSDTELLDVLERLPVLPPEMKGRWDTDDDWRLAYQFTALGDVARERQLRAAVLPLLRHASFGDPGEMMRGLRHTLEAIASPDWGFLARAYVAAAKLPEAGARLWSIAGLGVLRDPTTLPTIVAALRDPVVEVRWEACSALSMLCQTNPALRRQAMTELRLLFSDPDVGDMARRETESIARME